jgi:flagellar hook protein FlgE
MTLSNSLQTAVIGMNLQSRRMEAVSDNIANASTTGYKRVSAEIESLVIDASARNYTSGGGIAQLRYEVGGQGSIRQSANITDLSIDGRGFFVVSDANGNVRLTRAGAFVPDANGHLRNTAGFYLMGAPAAGVSDGATLTFGELERVTLGAGQLQAQPSTQGRLSTNLPSAATIVPNADLPSANVATAQFTARTSQVAYDNLGTAVTLDIYYSKTGPNQWEVTVFNAADRGAPAFPYAAAALATQITSFDPDNGRILPPKDLSLKVPGGQSLTIDMSNTTQLASAFTVNQSTNNGSAPTNLDAINISSNGILSYVDANGASVEAFRIPLGNVISPDNLLSISGNAYVEGPDSGQIVLGTAESGALGSILSSSLEASTVDLGVELATMIEAQRNYSANSKTFKTSSDMMEILMSLKN